MSKDKTRPQMMGVFYENGHAVATDSFILIADKQSYDASKEGKLYDSKGNEIQIQVGADGRKYPDWEKVIPPKSEAVVGAVDALEAQFDAIEKAKRDFVKSYFRANEPYYRSEEEKLKLRKDAVDAAERQYIAIVLPDGSIKKLVSNNKLRLFVEAARHLGTSDIEFNYSETRNVAIVARSENGVALLMPANTRGDNTGETLLTIDLSGSATQQGKPTEAEIAADKKVAEQKTTKEEARKQLEQQGKDDKQSKIAEDNANSSLNSDGKSLSSRGNEINLEDDFEAQRRWLEENKEQLIDNYINKHGNRLDPDEVRELFQPIGYDKNINVAKFTAIEDLLRWEFYDRMLDKALAEDKRSITLLSGIPASGKSSATQRLDLSSQGLVFDSAFNSVGSFEEAIEKALAKGFKEEDITILPIYNDPATIMRNNLDRGLRASRFVPLPYIIRCFDKSIDKLRTIHEEYPNITITPIDNSQNQGKEVSLDDALNWDYVLTKEIINEFLKIIAEYEHTSRITKEKADYVRGAVRSERTTVGSRQDDEGGDSRTYLEGSRETKEPSRGRGDERNGSVREQRLGLTPEDKINTNQNTNENGEEVQRLHSGSPRAGSNGLRENENGTLGESEQHPAQDTERKRVDGRDGKYAATDQTGNSRVAGQPASIEVVNVESQTKETARNTRNNRIKRGEVVVPKSDKERFDANIEAIKLMKSLVEKEASVPTKAQMQILRKYSGWGGLGGYLNYSHPKERQQLQELLTKQEFESALSSSRSAYYTPGYVIDYLWDIAAKLGFKGFKGVTLSDNELRYILWRSYENLKSGGLKGLFAKAQDIAKQNELKVGEFEEKDETIERTEELTEQQKETTEVVLGLIADAGIEVSMDEQEMAAALDGGAQLEAQMSRLDKAANTIREWLKNDVRNKSFEIKLPQFVRNKVRAEMGRDFDSHNITSNGIIHGLKGHGVNGDRLSDKSIPIREEDAALIPYIMTAPDMVVKGSTKNGRESVRFIKNISNGYVVVVEKEFDNSADDLETINIWAELSNVSNAQRTLNRTSETPTIGRSDIAKIQQDAEKAIAQDNLAQFMTVFHGSGAYFDHFDHSFMGSGEGAQAYGWGTYVTEVEDIGRKYASTIGKKRSESGLIDSFTIPRSVAENEEWQRAGKYVQEYTVRLLQEDIRYVYSNKTRNSPKNEEEILAFLKKDAKEWNSDARLEILLLNHLKPSDIVIKRTSVLYNVDIPENTGENYLSWWKHYDRKEIDKLCAKLEQVISPKEYDNVINEVNITFERLGHITGAWLYIGALSRALGSDKLASKALSKAGYVGIEYPAEAMSGGRADGAKTHTQFSIVSDQKKINEINNLFNKQLQQQIDGTLGKGHIYQLGMPSAELQSTGIPMLPIRLQASVLNQKSNDPAHKYDLNEIKDLVLLIQKPIAIFEYGDKTKAQNLMIGIAQKNAEGKQFLVGMSISPSVRGKALNINSIRNVFPKNFHDWIHWINQGKLLRVDGKAEIQTIIDALRINPVDYINKNDLDSATKIVNNFNNPSTDTLFRESDKAALDKEYLAAVERGDMETAQRMVNEAAETAFSECGSTHRQQWPARKKESAKGFYEKSTGKIVINVHNNSNIADIEQTLLHEAVAHYGLRQLFGEHFDTFLDNVYANAEQGIRHKIVRLATKNGWDLRKATEEYLAGLAENTEFENVQKTSWWQKVKDFFASMIRKLGFKGFKGVTLSDNELRYILWRSYENLKSGGLKGLFAKAQDIAKQNELKVGEFEEKGETIERTEELTEQQKETTEVVLGLIADAGIEVSMDEQEMREVYEASERLSEIQKETLETVSAQNEHHPTVVSSVDRAKVLNNLRNLKKDYINKAIIRPIAFVGDLARALSMPNLHRASQYNTFETKSGKVVTIRLSNHNAKVSNFDNLGENDGISIIVSSAPNQGITNDGNAHLVEYYYNSIKLRKAEGQALVDIIQSIEQALYSGEHKDTTGLAEVQEVNAVEQKAVERLLAKLFLHQAMPYKCVKIGSTLSYNLFLPL